MGSAVGMVLLYVFGGIGVGLFFMLRRRRVLWRQPVVWGVAVAFMQALAAINEWPLLWMSYDTAVPRTTFFAQQVRDDRRDVPRLLGVLRALVHGRRDADAGGVRRSPAVLARVVARARTAPPPFSAAPSADTCSSRSSSPTTSCSICSRRASSAGGRPPRRCSTPTSWRPTRRGCRRSPTRSRRASGRSACSGPYRSRAPRSSAIGSASAGSSS